MRDQITNPRDGLGRRVGECGTVHHAVEFAAVASTCVSPLSTFASTYCARSNSPRSPGKLLSRGTARHACRLSWRLLGRGFGNGTPRGGIRTFKGTGCRGLHLSRLGLARHGAAGALSTAANTSTAMAAFGDGNRSERSAHAQSSSVSFRHHRQHMKPLPPLPPDYELPCLKCPPCGSALPSCQVA